MNRLKTSSGSCMKTYLDFEELVCLMPPWPWSFEDQFGNRYLWYLNLSNFMTAKGSGHNHQAWEGGYLDHVRETIPFARTLNRMFP